jgi:hypothetical protein
MSILRDEGRLDLIDMGRDSFLQADTPPMTARRLWLSACMLASLTAVGLPAAQLSRGLRTAGDKAVTQNTIEWGDVNSPLLALQTAVSGDSEGWFSSLDGATITIDDLSRSAERAGSGFGPDAFLDIDADPTMPAPGADYILDDAYPASGCSVSLRAVDQARTATLPVTPSDSPFSFVNNSETAATPPIQTTTTCTLSRESGTQKGNFSAAFDQPLQTVGFVIPAYKPITNTFAATITVTAKLEPDGVYLLGSGFGLILLSLGSRRLFGKRLSK